MQSIPRGNVGAFSDAQFRIDAFSVRWRRLARGLTLIPELLIIDWCDYHSGAGGYSSDPTLLQKDRVNF
jgi:hypothetical protein